MTDNRDKGSHLIILLVLILALSSGAALPCTESNYNSLKGQSLINDTLSENWSSPYKDSTAWVIEKNVLSQKTSEKNFFGTDLVSINRYQNFILTFDFRYTKGANSGIKYLIQDDHGNIGLEYQILDDIHHEDNKTAKTRSAALYDIFPAINKPALLTNQYNQGCILFKNGYGEHWLNGKMVLSYDLSSDEFQKNIKQSKFKTFEWFGSYRSGKILLQHHGDKVYFKNLRLLEL